MMPQNPSSEEEDDEDEVDDGGLFSPLLVFFLNFDFAFPPAPPGMLRGKLGNVDEAVGKGEEKKYEWTIACFFARMEYVHTFISANHQALQKNTLLSTYLFSSNPSCRIKD